MANSMEQRVAALEGNVAQIREEWAVVAQAPLIQARLLNALRETQLEHSRALAAQGTQLQRLVGTVDEHGGILKEHSQILGEHGQLLIRHSGILEEHSGILEEHSVILKQHSGILEEHSVILKQHSGDLAELKLGQHTIVGMLTTLIEREPE